MSIDIILFSYSTNDGNEFTGLNYPSKALTSLTTGSTIKVISGNPNFKVIATEIILYNLGNKDNPLYLEPAIDRRRHVNVTPGIYQLQVNSEYTPSNNDVATFVETVQILGKSPVKDSNQLQGQSSADPINLPKDETSQKQKSVTTPGSLKIVIQVNDVNEDKHNKIVFAAVQSRTINFDSSKAGANRVYSTRFQIPKDAVETGEKFMACLISLQPLQQSITNEPMICKTGTNSL